LGIKKNYFDNKKVQEGSDFPELKCPCNSNKTGCDSIEFPPNEKILKNTQECINFTRSSPSFPTLDCSLTPKTNYTEQLNLVTSYIDGSQIYGNTKEKSDQLRLMSNGLLKTTSGISSPNSPYLPFTYDNENSDLCSKTNDSIRCFVGGDIRTSENLGLAGVQTLFLREHNRVATQLASVNPSWDDDKLFNEARHIVVAMYQHIVYNEWVSFYYVFTIP
jgi:hypothetical protein